MFWQRWLIGTVAAVVLANTGCVTCCHKSYQKALEHGPECELPTPCRGQVYLFMIHGTTPTCGCGLEELRAKLAENGFPKVGVGELASAPCVAHEIKKIHCCEPDARFVLLGYDFGGAAAVCLARDLSAKCIPVEAVVLLDPLGCGKPSGLHTLLITSGSTTSTVPFTERVTVSEASHFKLPAHPQTVAAITDLLSDIAARNYQEPGDPVPAWTYKHAPEMRAYPTAKTDVGPEWRFLADTSEMPPAINPRAGSQPMQWSRPITPIVPAAPSTSAGPVVIKR